jgi:diguanylate cyclase (GGDEF)-like protein
MPGWRHADDVEMETGDGADEITGATLVPAAGHASRQRLLWAAAGVVLALAGSAAAVVTARVEARHAADKARQGFVTSSAGVASSLQLAIQHEEDLMASASAFVAGNPGASERQFVGWAKDVRALQRYPELLGMGHAVIVPASRLAAFAAAAVRHRVTALPGGVFRVVPPGKRAFYCLVVATVSRATSPPVPAGFDYCGPSGPPSFLAARDSGKSAYVPFRAGTTTGLAVEVPVYRNGVTPASVGARRAAFLGWVGVSVNPGVLLARALVGHPATAVTFRYRAGASDVVIHRGAVPRSGQSAAIDLHNGWTVRTFAAAPVAGVLAHSGPRTLLLGGIALSVLLGLFAFMLGTGRARALRLVTLRTGELRHQALHDALTGLPNRALITDRVEQLLARGRRHGSACAVLFMDLDGFKNVNDTLGHAVGDALLQSAATRLATSLREVDTIGRLGGDEFVILIDDKSHQAPEVVAQRLLDVMRQPFELDGAPRPIRVTASVGIAVGTQGTGGELLRDADLALYRAKANGKDVYEVFHPAMEAAARQDLETELDLRSALDENQFRLVYQPTYSLDDLSLVGVEALLRWDHPTQGTIEPNDFISLLEASGQICDVGRWVLNSACQQMARWHDQDRTMGVAVNVSGRQLDDDTIVTDIRDALTRSSLDPTKLTIEITETTLMRDIGATAARLQEIKALGVTIAIDDFGSGYSSLASLEKLPIDTIKIDRALTNELRRSPQSDALVRTLVQLGRDLGLNTLAEGVETLEQLDQLRGERIDEVQGFLLSKPLETAAIEVLILPHDLAGPDRARPSR